jgi:hypothetical protein
MADLTAITADMTALETAVAELKAAPTVSQSDIDALSARLVAVTAEIQALTPAPVA